MTNQARKFIKTLVSAPDNQIDAPIKVRIAGLLSCDGSDARFHLKEIIDDCVRGSLATDFAVAFMVKLYRENCFWV